MSRVEELRAELALLEQEADFAAAKQTGQDTPELRAALREARRAFREQRAGSATAAPEPIRTTSGVNESGA